MTVGNIAVGAYGSTARQYMLEGGATGMKRYRVNPQATKMGQGIKKYEDQEFWDYWTMTDWKAGIGQTEPDASGSLFSTCLTHIPNQIILSPQQGFNNLLARGSAGGDGYWSPTQGTTYTSQTISDSGTWRQIAVKLSITVPASTTYSISSVGVFASLPMVSGTTTTLKFDIEEDSSGSPDGNPTSSLTELTSEETTPGFYWFSVTLTNPWTYANATGSPVAITKWLVVRPGTGDSCIIAGSTNNYTNAVTKRYSGSAWSAETSIYPFYVTDLGTDNARQVVAMKPVTGSPGTYATIYDSTPNPDQTSIYKADTGSDNNWDLYDLTGNDYWAENKGADNTWQVARFDGNVNVVPLSGSSYGYTGGGGYTEVAAGADAFFYYRGYYYRALDNDLYYDTVYTNATWANGPFQMCSDNGQITAIAGLGDYVYAVTTEGLTWLAPGDIAVGVTPWEQTDANNGKGTVTHKNALYIPLNGQLFQYSESGGLLNIWLEREDIPVSRIGNFQAMISTHHMLYVLVAGPDTTNWATFTGDRKSQILGWDGTGWHHIASLPAALDFRSISYDRVNDRLWVGGDGPVWMYVKLPTNTVNPYNDDTQDYMSHGWIETPYFDGAVLANNKDFESATIIGENLAAGQTVAVYWKDDASTSWELLGTATSNNETLRWSDYTTRPSTKRFRLGLLLATTDPSETPRVQAVVVRFLTNVTDRYGWNLRIQVSANTVYLDGAVQTYTVAQQAAHLDALEVQTPPFPFTDNQEGTTYEVRIMQASRDTIQHVYDGSTHTTDYVYNWTLEETN